MTDEEANVSGMSDEEAAALEENAAELGAPDGALTGEVVEAEEQQEGEQDGLLKELEECRSKVNEYLDGWQRARADFANYRKRVERDQTQTQQNATGNVIRRYLDILDDLERALNNRPQEGEGAVWAQGIELIYRKFNNLLEAEGVKMMDAAGQPFDPTQHEAITHEESDDHESGEVIEVVKQGYLLGDRVLRPALVRVAR